VLCTKTEEGQIGVEKKTSGRAAAELGGSASLGWRWRVGWGLFIGNGGGAVPTLPCSPSMATLWPCGHLRSSLSGASVKGEQVDTAAQGVGGASGRRWCCAGRRAARRASGVLVECVPRVLRMGEQGAGRKKKKGGEGKKKKERRKEKEKREEKKKGGGRRRDSRRRSRAGLGVDEKPSARQTRRIGKLDDD